MKRIAILLVTALAADAPAILSPLPSAACSPHVPATGKDNREASGGTDSNPLSREAVSDYRIVRDYIVRAAEKMPDEGYSFKPTPEIRNFGQLIGHIADDQYRYCSAARGDTRSAKFETNTPPKAEMLTALKAAFAYCDATYDAINDGSATHMVIFSGRSVPELTVLTLHAGHAWEHYGNIVIYMRLKGLVPPSSEKRK
jgi:uncharacterized damage-inducible protein DinB